MNMPKPLLGTAFILCTAIMITGCKKDKEDAPVDPGPAAPVGLASADAILYTSASTSDGGPTTYAALARFRSGGNFVSAGPVAVNGVDLDQLSTGVYLSPVPSTLDLSSATMWSVAGSSGGFPSFMRDDTSIPFPTVAAISSGGTVDLSDGYTLETTQLSGADSVEFRIGPLHRTIAGNVSSTYFSAADLASLNPTTLESVVILGYTYSSFMVGDKRVFSQRATSSSKSVVIVE